jgi:protein arginine kinase activator
MALELPTERGTEPGDAPMKCQKCTKAATLHITEVISDEQFEELHLCEECANKYLYEPQPNKPGGSKASAAESAPDLEEGNALNQRECPLCGIKFVEFRNSGRLGCPHDYQEFREELAPLLENIHGETKHCGKTPRRLPQNKQTQSELIQLRNRLKQAVTKEDYEEAARLRDRIRQLEES